MLRIGSEYNPTGTAYYLVLAEEPQLLFSVQGSLSDELALTREGDQVKVEYYPRESATQELTGFDNLEFEQKHSGGMKTGAFCNGRRPLLF